MHTSIKPTPSPTTTQAQYHLEAHCNTIAHIQPSGAISCNSFTDKPAGMNRFCTSAALMLLAATVSAPTVLGYDYLGCSDQTQDPSTTVCASSSYSCHQWTQYPISRGTSATVLVALASTGQTVTLPYFKLYSNGNDKVTIRVDYGDGTQDTFNPDPSNNDCMYPPMMSNWNYNILTGHPSQSLTISFSCNNLHDTCNVWSASAVNYVQNPTVAPTPAPTTSAAGSVQCSCYDSSTNVVTSTGYSNDNTCTANCPSFCQAYPLNGCGSTSVISSSSTSSTFNGGSSSSSSSSSSGTTTVSSSITTSSAGASGSSSAYSSSDDLVALQGYSDSSCTVANNQVASGTAANGVCTNLTSASLLPNCASTSSSSSWTVSVWEATGCTASGSTAAAATISGTGTTCTAASVNGQVIGYVKVDCSNHGANSASGSQKTGGAAGAFHGMMATWVGFAIAAATLISA